jgi:hypothetical protein
LPRVQRHTSALSSLTDAQVVLDSKLYARKRLLELRGRVLDAVDAFLNKSGAYIMLDDERANIPLDPRCPSVTQTKN